jgi:hypothetical protein
LEEKSMFELLRKVNASKVVAETPIEASHVRPIMSAAVPVMATPAAAAVGAVAGAAGLVGGAVGMANAAED